jgi:xylulokinase
VARHILGIDVGTTSVKAGVIDGDGRIVARFDQAYPTHRHGRNLAEQDPADWLRLIRAAMEAFAGYQVAAIGLTSQVNTHVFVGADGAALMPAILWQDGRAGAEAAALDARVTPAQKQAWWGAPMPIDASHAASRMAWVAVHRPEVWEATRWVMLPKDYCLLALTGEAVTDPLSNVGLVDTALAYVPEVLALVPGAAERMAPLAPICAVSGRIRHRPFAGVPVVTGTMDAWAGLVGAGGARDRSSMYLSGTSEILGISSREVVPTPGAIVFAECEGVRLHAAPTQSGGDALAWFAGVQGISVEAVSGMVGPRGGAVPLFLPQLQGERAPIWDADLRAAFLGVGRQTGAAEMARAVMEGVAMAARMALETLRASSGVPPGPVTCGGGGFRSEPWNQIRADVLGVPLRRLAATDPGIVGAATMAAIGVGDFAGFEEAYAALARFDATYEPDLAMRGLYDDLYGLYCEAIPLNAGLGKRLARLA